jgi:plastocyanin
MKLFVLAILILLIPGLISPVAAEKNTDKDTSHNVSIKDMKFDPAELDIAVGDTVVWTNNDDRDHTVVAKNKTFQSDNLSKGDTYQYTFKKAGKFDYSCSYHPRMKGTITVGSSN